MGINDRKQRERERFKKSIINAAQDLFYQNGFHNVSMRKIALKIEYSPTTIYHYFKNKEEILGRIVKEYFDELALEAEPILAKKDESPFTALHDYMLLYAKKSMQSAKQYRFLTSIFSEQSKINLGQTNANAGYLRIKELLKLCMEKKLIRQNDEDLVTQSLWMVLYGVTVLLASRPDFQWADKEKLVEFTIQNHLNSLR
jgi:AcrR family transcriptional regulator